MSESRKEFENFFTSFPIQIASENNCKHFRCLNKNNNVYIKNRRIFRARFNDYI